MFTKIQTLSPARREFLQLTAAGVLSAGAPAALAAPTPQLAATYAVSDQHYGVALLDAEGKITWRARLPGRGHDCVYRPGSPQLVVFARRPGTFMQIIDVTGARVPQQVNSAPGRHFYGHGVFSSDGALLYATENDFEAAHGVIGIYDARRGYARVGEFDSGGVGPHDLVLQRDGRTLIVANGGIETHPDFGREKLNLATMRSNLAVLDVRTGERLHSVALPEELRKLSLRHFALDTQGNCHVGGQYEGGLEDQPPLLGSLKRNGQFALWQTPPAVLGALQNYISSVCVIPGQSQIITSSSRGGVAVVWDTQRQRVVQVLEVFDGSGVAGTANQLYVSDGGGRVSRYAPLETRHWHASQMHTTAGLHWDNHLAITLA